MSKPSRIRKGRIKAKRVLDIQEQYDEKYSDEEYKKHLHALTHTRKLCSCWMCGNPRKHFKEKTMQEKKADLKYKDQLRET